MMVSSFYIFFIHSQLKIHFHRRSSPTNGDRIYNNQEIDTVDKKAGNLIIISKIKTRFRICGGCFVPTLSGLARKK